MPAKFRADARKVWATFLRDARLMMSYRLAFFLDWFAIVASVVGLWFVSKLVPASAAFGSGHVATYFNYAVVNVAFVTLQGTALMCFENFDPQRSSIRYARGRPRNADERFASRLSRGRMGVHVCVHSSRAISYRGDTSWARPSPCEPCLTCDISDLVDYGNGSDRYHRSSNDRSVQANRTDSDDFRPRFDGARRRTVSDFTLAPLVAGRVVDASTHACAYRNPRSVWRREPASSLR